MPPEYINENWWPTKIAYLYESWVLSQVQEGNREYTLIRAAVGAAFNKEAPNKIFLEPGEHVEKIDLAERQQKLLEEQARKKAEEEARKQQAEEEQKQKESMPVQIRYE